MNGRSIDQNLALGYARLAGPTEYMRERISQRVPEGERATVERAITAALRACERASIRDAAVRVARASVKHASADGSNGECYVLVVRGGRAATFMLRRASQPHTAAAYAVERVLCVKGTCSPTEHASHR